MTEIQFLISLMLEHPKMPEQLKQKLITRIGEVEALLQRPGYMTAVTPRLITTAQAPSTQRILDEDAGVLNTQTIAASMQAPVIATQRIKGGEIQTGNGTKGPRKW